MWIGIAAAQKRTGERQIVGADNSRPAANVTITFSARASNGTPQVSAGRVTARYNISRPAISAGAQKGLHHPGCAAEHRAAADRAPEVTLAAMQHRPRPGSRDGDDPQCRPERAGDEG